MELHEVLALTISTLDMIATAALALVAYRFTKRYSTQQALDLLNSEIKVLDRRLTEKLSPSQEITLEKIESDSEVKADLFDFLNAYEAIASGVNTGLYDEKTVRALRRGALTGTYRRFKVFIAHCQKEYPHAWRQLQVLADRWERQEAMSVR